MTQKHAHGCQVRNLQPFFCSSDTTTYKPRSGIILYGYMFLTDQNYFFTELSIKLSSECNHVLRIGDEFRQWFALINNLLQTLSTLICSRDLCGWKWSYSNRIISSLFGKVMEELLFPLLLHKWGMQANLPSEL